MQVSPEIQSRLQTLIEDAAAEVLANDRDTMQRQYDQMVREYQAGYRDHRLWVQGRQEADARWLAAIAEQQGRVTKGGASWQHLEAVARRVTGGRP